MPRAGLTPAVVAETAARLADEEGFDRLSLSSVAKAAGVAVPSLYKHVAGLSGLRRAVGLLSAREFGAVVTRACLGRSGEEALRSVAAAYRDYARAHPGRYASLNLAPAPEDAEAAEAYRVPVDVLAAVLRGFGVPEEEAVDEVRALRSALHGFVDLEARGGFGLPRDVDRSFEVLVDRCVAGLRARSG
ncbi:TetR/AcrR family transcriptional regulator [Nocardiopsis sp. CNT-189]|uniref:TetR/AcrR family transcriptional regulator n=1 Tax=Nocardiopsis oceanisediminis TaxID=2816862 RepID=UPI003B2EAA2E